MRLRTNRRHCRRGTTIIATVVMLPLLAGFIALAVDVGLMYCTKVELQDAADAASLAAAAQLPYQDSVLSTATQLATINRPEDGLVLAPSDVVIGNWDSDIRVFSPGGSPTNAVEVTVRRSEANGNPLELLFARVFGDLAADVSARAVAAHNNCFDRGIIAGRLVSIAEFEMEDTDGSYCIYGRQGVTIDELELEDGGTVSVGALDDATIVLDSEPPGLDIVEANLQPTRAQRAAQLVSEIESGVAVEQGTSVVVLSGPVTFSPGSLLPDTAYVIDGDATVAGGTLIDVTLAVRGTLTFQDDVKLARSSATPDSLPITVVATDDIFAEDLHEASGVTLIAGRDFIAQEEVEGEPIGEINYGVSIEAGRDVIIMDEFELEHLDLNFAVPFGGSAPVLVM
ncbi:MAG: pilus assembly protein TadG-related protein [Phycisphaerae bacterium]